MKKFLVTGSCGFIGFNVCRRLLLEGFQVFGVDNMNDYYDVSLKVARLNQLSSLDDFQFSKVSIASEEFLELCSRERFDYIINLAAQAGVRYSSENPDVYIESNINGFFNVLKAARDHIPDHLIFASTSSVYGLNGKYPYKASDPATHQVSLYAATKKANESLAHSYSHLYKIPTTALRFFTVYGPWGRPDMALFLFTDAILNNRPIRVFNEGNLWRDFTYIDDIVESIVRLIPKAPTINRNFCLETMDQSDSVAPFSIFNIGNGQPIKLMDMIETLEDVLSKKALKVFEPLQAGDVFKTFADSRPLFELTGFAPETSLRKGIESFVQWYKEYYKVK